MNIWKFKKYITFWELPVLRCGNGFAWIAIYLGFMGCLENIEAACCGYFWMYEFVTYPLEMVIGILGLLYVKRIANRVVAKAEADIAEEE